MISEYYRPETMEEAVRLLSRHTPVTVPLGGGTSLNRPGGDALAVVDLQALGLAEIRQEGANLNIGASATLQSLLESNLTPPALCQALNQEAPLHIRQAGTLAGTLVSATSRSPVGAACLALDARLIWAPDESQSLLSDLFLVDFKMPGLFIKLVVLPANCNLAYHSVARTPADWPIVCAAAARWPSGRVRLVLGGFGPRPMMVMDGRGGEGAAQAARDAYSQAGDEWASAEYRSETAAVLADRCIHHLEAE